MTGLLERFEQHLVAQRLFKRGERVVVAVSGGVDSMALLHLMHLLTPSFGWKLSVAHFNHRLRGRSSDADERLVRVTARQLKLICDVASADVRKVAAEQGISIEMAARQVRHAFLAECARRRKARVVALAQHADDQVELFLLRLLRGAGGEGLGGMKAISPSPTNRRTARGDGRLTGKRVFLVRPLLEFSKAEIAAFAREMRLRFRADASNASTEFDRNWVRLKLLPLLRERQPAVGKTILRAMQIAGAEGEFSTQFAEAWLKRAEANTSSDAQMSSLGFQMGRTHVRSYENRGAGLVGGLPGGFSELPVAVQRQIVQLQLRGLGVEPDFQLVETLRRRANQPVSVGRGVEIVCDPEGRVCRTPDASAKFMSGRRVVEILTPKSGSRQRSLAFGKLRLTWKVVRRPRHFVPKREPGREVFDADQVGERFVLRHWRPGDRFQPIGLPSATKLQDWFTNRKVPLARRRAVVLAETERGEVFWVQGERIGETCKVTFKTRRLLEIHWKEGHAAVAVARGAW